VGDSISRIQLLPASPFPCGNAGGGTCLFSEDFALTWPTAMARLAGSSVLNLAVPGAQTTVASLPDIPAITDAQVPQVPPNTDVVVYAGGTNDLAATPVAAALPRIDVVLAKIRAQAPLARIIALNVRRFKVASNPACCAAQADAWDDHLAVAVGRIGGTVIEMRSPWPDFASDDWRDGIHPGPNAVQKIGALVAAKI
jgi:lysophospholipase L1-like esterase